MQALGIKGILTVASHGIDELWAEDGISYMTAVVTPSNPLGEQLEECVGFLERNLPAVVCCSSGIGASAVVGAAFLLNTSRSNSATSAIDSIRDAVGGGRLDISTEEVEALEAFCDSRLNLTPPAAKPTAVDTLEADDLRLRPLMPSPVSDKKPAVGVPSKHASKMEKLQRTETETVSSKRARRGISLEMAQA